MREAHHSMFIIDGRKMAATDGGYYTTHAIDADALYIFFGFVNTYLVEHRQYADTPIHHQKITETANTHISFTAVSDTGTWYTQRIQRISNHSHIIKHKEEKKKKKKLSQST